MDFLNNAVHAAIYYAGLFDGEGSVGIYLMGKKRTNPIGYPLLAAKLTNSFHPALMYPLNKFGGNIENNKASEKNIGWLDTFTWRVYSDKAFDFLEWIYPYTIIKKDQIDVVKEFWTIYQPYRQNKYNRLDQTIIDQYVSTLKALKRGK